METEHTETVVEKAVAYVKDSVVIQTDTAPDVQAKPEYHDTASEVTAENAMRLDPNAYATSVGRLNGENYVRPVAETDADRLRREVDEYPREKSALELNADSARAEDGG